MVRLFAALLLLGGLTAAPAHAEGEEPVPFVTTQGQVQIQMDQGSLGGSTPNAFTPVRSGIGIFPAHSQIYIRRLRVIPTFHLAPGLDLVNETDIDTDELEFNGYRFSLQFLYLRAKVGDGNLQVGQLKVPFGWELYRSSRTTNTIERSDVSNSYNQSDLGLTYILQDGDRFFGAGVLQGQGPGNRDVNAAKDFAFRYVHPVADGLQVGLSGYEGSFRPSSLTDDLPVRRLGTEVHYRTGPLLLEGEYVVGDGYNNFSRRATPSRGYYATAVYTLAEDLDGVLSYDRFDPDLGRVDLAQPNNRTNDRSRFVVGLNWYVTRDPVHRVMLNYEIRTEEQGPPLTTNGFRVRYQFAW